jgi:alpha-L-fucosidase
MALASRLLPPATAFGQAEAPIEHRLPANDVHRRIVQSYIEEVPIPSYSWAPEQAYEAFRDTKYGVRIHWGIYSVQGFTNESWGFLRLPYEERAHYNELYKKWNPTGFDAEEWTSFFVENGMRMFAFTTKHHEGFSMFDTKTRVRQRVRWDAPGGPKLENCDLAYSIMETPYRRDVVRELCEAGHKRGLRIALYFSHPDWYDADFRPYAEDPVQVPSAPELDPEWQSSRSLLGKLLWMAPDPTPEDVRRMMHRHRAQVEELLTNYGDIQMISFDQWLGPKVWPQLRQTLLDIRKLQPNVMLRARGIGNYGDYYTPEGFVPGSKENTEMPWMVIYPLARGFSYDPVGANYKGAKWVVSNIVDTAAKGGGFQVGIGPDANGKFHPAAIEQLKQTGDWLKTCGGGIYATRPRDGDKWHEGDSIRYTQSKDKRTIYCFSYKWPGTSLRLNTVVPLPKSAITMFGYPAPLKWRYSSASGLVIDLPERAASLDNGVSAWGWKISVG